MALIQKERGFSLLEVLLALTLLGVALLGLVGLSPLLLQQPEAGQLLTADEILSFVDEWLEEQDFDALPAWLADSPRLYLAVTIREGQRTTSFLDTTEAALPTPVGGERWLYALEVLESEAFAGGTHHIVLEIWVHEPVVVNPTTSQDRLEAQLTAAPLATVRHTVLHR